MRLPILLLALVLAPLALAQSAVERWGLFEAALTRPAEGNPFTEVTLTATFTSGGAAREVTGFYDGGGTYRVCFMPETTGERRHTTRSNRPALDGKSGAFTAVAPSAKNHGPVRVAHTFHFAYADGTPFRQVGTTCYAWTHQTDALEEQTLRTLAISPFNKIRLCVFPKTYEWNKNEPAFYPFAGTLPTQWDTARFNPAFFQHLEKSLAQIRDLGIEADLILFHLYDKGRWGFDRMDSASDDRYLRYVVARLEGRRAEGREPGAPRVPAKNHGRVARRRHRADRPVAGGAHRRQGRRILSPLLRQGSARELDVCAQQGSAEGRPEFPSRDSRHVGDDHHAPRGNFHDEEARQLRLRGRREKIRRAPRQTQPALRIRRAN